MKMRKNLQQKRAELPGQKILPQDICRRLQKQGKQTHPGIVVKFCRPSVKHAIMKNKKGCNIIHT